MSLTAMRRMGSKKGIRSFCSGVAACDAGRRIVQDVPSDHQSIGAARRGRMMGCDHCYIHVEI